MGDLGQFYFIYEELLKIAEVQARVQLSYGDDEILTDEQVVLLDEEADFLFIEKVNDLYLLNMSMLKLDFDNMESIDVLYSVFTEYAEAKTRKLLSYEDNLFSRMKRFTK
eukprot:Tbor_TRINITY_DN6198_c1_g1::TRINITY_DN6198_c1_g1_i13::g.21954::m.21954